MKIVTVLGSKMQAEMIIGVLRANGIEAFLNGSREYASIVTGQDIGRYEISASDDDAQAAQILISRFNDLPAVREKTAPTAWSLLKRAMIFALLGAIVLPIVFNVLSLINLFKFLKIAKKSPSTFVGAGAVIILNLLVIVTLYVAGKSLA